MRQFSENGSDSTALTYDQQKNDAFWSSLGWQVAGNVERLPAVRARDLGIQLRRRHAPGRAPSRTRSHGTYVVPGFEQDDNWWLFDLGVSRDFGRVTGFLSGNASAGKGDGDYWA